jgi:hypothetical protein
MLGCPPAYTLPHLYSMFSDRLARLGQAERWAVFGVFFVLNYVDSFGKYWYNSVIRGEYCLRILTRVKERWHNKVIGL